MQAVPHLVDDRMAELHRAAPQARSALPDWAALQADAERAAARFAASSAAPSESAADDLLEPPDQFRLAGLALCGGWALVAVAAIVLWLGLAPAGW
jgi:hypothetical protein